MYFFDFSITTDTPLGKWRGFPVFLCPRCMHISQRLSLDWPLSEHSERMTGQWQGFWQIHTISKIFKQLNIAVTLTCWDILMNQRKFLVMNWVNVLKQYKTKQKYQKFRFKILRYCENKMHKMLNENLAHKNGLLHVYDLYLDEFDWLHWSLRHTSILICTLVYISVIILFLKCLCYTSVCI